MARFNLVYLLLLTCLFWCFISVLDGNRLKAVSLSQKVPADAFKHQWKVAEVKEIQTSQLVSDARSRRVVEFLSSGGFVEYDGKEIHKTGSWKVRNNQLQIEYDDASQPALLYEVEVVRPEEILMIDNKLQLRLLRMQI